MKNRFSIAAALALCVSVLLLFASCSLFESIPYFESESVSAKDYYTDKDAKRDRPDFGKIAVISEPQTKIASDSAIAAAYEPVYPLVIAKESVAAPVELHSAVPENLRNVYSVMLGGIRAKKGEIVFSKPVPLDSMRRAVIYVRDLNPDLFYVDWSAYTYSEGDKGVTGICFDFLDMDIDACSAAFEQTVGEIVANANALPNLFERELYVHDYLVNNVVYSVSTDNSGSAYGALIDGCARCEGYARAFQLLMLRLGIESYTSVGTAEGERHMWNTVNLYGRYYNVDVTFDDDTRNSYKTAFSESQIRHSCFNVPDEILFATHSLSGIASFDRFGSYQNLFLPECNSLDYSFYRVRGYMIKNLEQFKYLLSKGSASNHIEVFFDGDMPSSAEFRAAFDGFYRDSGRTGGYSVYYSPENSDIYLRHVFELSWDDN
jgi:hypothetical protein